MEIIVDAILATYLIMKTIVKVFPGKWRVKHMIKHWKSFVKKCFKDRNILTFELLTILSQVNTGLQI